MRVKEYFEKNIDKVYVGQKFNLHFAFWTDGPHVFRIGSINKQNKTVNLVGANPNEYGGPSNHWNSLITVTPISRKIGVFKHE